MNKTLPFDAEQSLTKLGANLATARKRRKWRQADVKDRTGLNTITIRKIESGDPGVSMRNYMLLIALYGGCQAVDNIVHPDDDLIGLDYAQSLPERVRQRKIIDNDF